MVNSIKMRALISALWSSHFPVYKVISMQQQCRTGRFLFENKALTYVYVYVCLDDNTNLKTLESTKRKVAMSKHNEYLDLNLM